MFTIFVHEIERVATFFNNTCASFISNRIWQTIPITVGVYHVILQNAKKGNVLFVLN